MCSRHGSRCGQRWRLGGRRPSWRSCMRWRPWRQTCLCCTTRAGRKEWVGTSGVELDAVCRLPCVGCCVSVAVCLLLCMLHLHRFRVVDDAVLFGRLEQEASLQHDARGQQHGQQHGRCSPEDMTIELHDSTRCVIVQQHRRAHTHPSCTGRSSMPRPAASRRWTALDCGDCLPTGCLPQSPDAMRYVKGGG